MCGICGVIDYRTSGKIDEGLLKKMSSKMRHRGPDDDGLYISKDYPHVGLAHRRLSIIDLSSAGHQPISNENKTLWMVFNGEIYNYIDLRNDLKEKGHRFASSSDSEVIVHLYEEYEEDCLQHLRGMFAFALWDTKKKRLFIARDRIGKKPLVYSHKNGIFTFASEFSALLESNFIDKKTRMQSIGSYLTFGYVPAPFTIYEEVFKLLPGHYLLLKDDKLSVEKYWDLDYSKKNIISFQDAQSEVIRLLKEAVKLRLYSDVPIGAFLSGGIDSSIVVALMSELNNGRVKTFSIGFDSKNYNELEFARKVADRFNTEHHEFIVRPNATEILPLLIEHYGEPYADSSCIPTYYVSQETKRYVTVALNGDGGDETFAGYERYFAMNLTEKFPFWLRSSLNYVSRLLPDAVNSRNAFSKLKRFITAVQLPAKKRYLKWVGICSEDLTSRILSENLKHKINRQIDIDIEKNFLSHNDSMDLVDSLLKTDVSTYLPNDLLVKVDITSMANSLECRSPFLDHKLMEFVAGLPSEFKLKGSQKKYILKETFKGLIPDENIYRKKMGFGVPIGTWFRKELKGLLTESLLSKRFLDRGYFDREVVKELVKSHLESKHDYSFQLWALLMLELWHRRFID